MYPVGISRSVSDLEVKKRIAGAAEVPLQKISVFPSECKTLRENKNHLYLSKTFSVITRGFTLGIVFRPVLLQCGQLLLSRLDRPTK